jgi:hypothetical protein
MADVYKYRITVELALATHESAKEVREFLREYVTEDWAAIRTKLKEDGTFMQGYIDAVLDVDVRTKRLDDKATIGPPVTITVAGATCQWCAKPFPDQVVTQLPFTCPICRGTLAVEAKGQVRT